jgi:hypothetical protein
MNEQTRLEQLAIAAHDRGDDWATFWSSVASDVAAMGLDYYARGELIHKLVAIVAAGDCDGQRPPGDRISWQVDEPPAYPQSDDTTVARIDWGGIRPERGATA